MTRRFVIAALATLAVLLCSAASAAAIDGGVPDGNRHPNVGLLAWDPDGLGETPPFAICTGSVISDSAFLTARHCIEPPLVPLPPSVQWVVTLEPGTPTAPAAPWRILPGRLPDLLRAHGRRGPPGRRTRHGDVTVPRGAGWKAGCVFA